ncbi:MAG TPA: peptide deformylase [Candidatus Aphodomonas merdavium]|nr:peptide deformylase [Candidatus Aphodomonas merdavium]
MAIRQVVKIGEEVLRKKSRPVDVLNRRILTLLDDMAETMYAEDGVGLAAPQVGVLRRAITVDVGDENGLFQLVNPQIVSMEGEQESLEGCLSVPGRHGVVPRPKRVTVQALNRAGRPVQIEAEGLLAVALCHEIDHLDGILYIDKQIREVEEEELLRGKEAEPT